MAFGDHIQSVGEDAGFVTVDTQAYGSNNTAGNILVSILRVSGATLRTVYIMSDTQGNQWYRALSVLATGDHNLEIWYALNCKAGANTVSATLTASLTLRWIIAEYTGNGVFSTAPDAERSTNSANSTSLDSLSVTTTDANTLLIGGNSMSSDSGGLTATNSFTERQEIVQRVQLQDRVLTSTATVNSTATAGAASQWAAAVIAINNGPTNNLMWVKG